MWAKCGYVGGRSSKLYLNFKRVSEKEWYSTHGCLGRVRERALTKSVRLKVLLLKFMPKTFLQMLLLLLFLLVSLYCRKKKQRERNLANEPFYSCWRDSGCSIFVLWLCSNRNDEHTVLFFFWYYFLAARKLRPDESDLRGYLTVAFNALRTRYKQAIGMGRRGPLQPHHS